MGETYFLLWNEQCPARPYGLSHAHDRDCDEHHFPPHAQGQCCECGSHRFYPPAMMGAEAIRQRMQQLGLTPAEPVVEETEMEDIAAPIDGPEHTGDEYVEPRYVTGNGPTGKRLGWGRGEPTPRFLARVEAFVGWREWLAQRGEGEQ